MRARVRFCSVFRGRRASARSGSPSRAGARPRARELPCPLASVFYRSVSCSFRRPVLALFVPQVSCRVARKCPDGLCFASCVRVVPSAASSGRLGYSPASPWLRPPLPPRAPPRIATFSRAPARQ